MPRHSLRIAGSLMVGSLALACASPALAAPDPAFPAEILDLQGSGEARPTVQAAWRPAQTGQGLPGGAFVRTGMASRMALLFADETQIRLNQNTTLQVKDVARDGSGATSLRLEQGRAWAQARRAPDGLQLETPAATAAIRGTSWELEVEPSGRTTLVVLSGAVEFYNEQGRLTVERDEAATAEVGKAPVKILLLRPLDRVQWVNALRFEPRRYAAAALTSPPLARALAAIRSGDGARAREILEAARREGTREIAVYAALADLELVDGNTGAAIGVARDGLAFAPRSPELLARLARAQLLADQVDDAEGTLAQPHDGEPPGYLVVAGEAAKRRGRVAEAFAAFGDATRADAGDDRGWYELGAAQNEREDIAPARRNLDQALALNPDGAGYQGELGTLETFANRFGAAERAFTAALAANPGDFVALTGLGLLRLKQGNARAALDAFLRAGVMEPRYARAKSYTAVAYYQLGRHEEAIATLRQAAELDDKDPLPYLYLSQIFTDLYRGGEAVAAARAALQRLPNLKSLNQIANDQQGKANLGYSLAFFGLEEWAKELAQQSYNPYSGSSHLFLADRYNGEFNKNSELFQGFLADPTAFGGSNRFSTLVPTAGRYGTAGFTYDTGDLRLSNPYLRLNGIVDWPTRSAYFADVESGVGTVLTRNADPDGRMVETTGDIRAELYAFGAGTLLTDQLGLFAYGTKFRFEDILRDSNRTIGDFNKARVDVGAHWRFSPTAMTWLKFGRTDDHRLFDRYIIFNADVTAALGANSKFDSRPSDLEARHTMDVTPADHLSVGAEIADDHRQGEFFAGGVVQTPQGYVGFGQLVDQDIRLKSTQAYVSYIRELSPQISLQGEVFWQRFSQQVKEDRAALVRVGDTSIPFVQLVDSGATDREFNPRLGLVWKPGAMTVRAAWQRWRQPASVSTLAPVATAGIPLDDQLVATGGMAKRGVVLVHAELDARTDVSAFADYEKIRNLGQLGFRIPTPNIQFVDLLRNAQIINVASLETLEGVPDFDAGTAESAGIAINRILSPQLSVSARYVHTRNTAERYTKNGDGDIVRTDEGGRIPFVPAQFAALGVTWVSPLGLYVSAQAVYRSQRYTDRDNTPAGRIPADWTSQFAAFWETPDKRLIVAAGAFNLGSKAAKELYVADVRYRF